MNFGHFIDGFLLDKNYLLLFLIFFSGVFFSAANLSKISFFNFLKPLIFASLGFFALRVNVEYQENLLSGIMIAGIVLSFIISSFISLREKNEKKLDFLVFLYFGLLILPFIQTFLRYNLFHLFTLLELLAIIGFVFLIIDYEDSKLDSKITNELIEKQNSKKNIAMRYFLAHCFSGLLFMLGIIGMITNGASISLIDLFNGNIRVNYLIIISLFINIAIPFFSFWFIQSYSSARFSFSLLMMSGVSKVSLILLFFISQNNVIPYLEIIGIVTMLYGSIMTLQEINIRRFFCYALVSHNGFLILAISQKIPQSLFLECMTISFILQNLFASFIFLASYNAKDYYFSEIEKNIKKYKFLFFAGVVTNWFFISMPYSVGFFSKFAMIHEINTSWIKTGFYWTTIINIFSHLFIFNYRLFSKQNLMFNKSFSQNDYMKNIAIFFISIIPICLLYIYVYKNNILPSKEIFIKYSIFTSFSCVLFILLHRFFTKNQLLPYDITILFEYFKKLLNAIFYGFKKIEDYLEKYFKALKSNISSIPSHKKYLNAYHFVAIFFFFWMCFFVYSI